MNDTTPASPAPAASGPLATIVRNITSNWAALLVTTLVSFFLAPIVVNSLGSVYYGIWTLLSQFTGYLWLLDFGVRESVIKYVAQYHASGERDKLEATVRTAISVYGVVSLAGFLAIGGLTWALPYAFNIPAEAVSTARIAAFVLGSTVAQSFLSNVFVGVLMGLQRFYLVSRIGIVFALFRAVSIYLLLGHGYGIVALSLLQLALSMVSSVLVFHLCRMHLPGVPLHPVRPTRVEVVKLLNYGKYVLIANIGDKIVFATDAMVIGIFLPIAALTPFAIAGTLIGNMRSVVMAMGSIFNPLTSSLRTAAGDRSVAVVVQTGSKAAMVVGLPLCIGFIVLGERFIALWMGNTYAPMAGRVMTVLSVGYIIGLPYSTISGVLYGLGEHRIIAMLRIVEGAANLGLSLILIQFYGLVGVAVGTAVPHAIVVGLVLPLTLPRVCPISLRNYYIAVYARSLGASIPFWIACWLIANVVRPVHLPNFLAWGMFSLVAYAIPCWFLAITGTERSHLSRAIRQRLPLAWRLREV